MFNQCGNWPTSSTHRVIGCGILYFPCKYEALVRVKLHGAINKFEKQNVMESLCFCLRLVGDQKKCAKDGINWIQSKSLGRTPESQNQMRFTSLWTSASSNIVKIRKIPAPQLLIVMTPQRVHPAPRAHLQRKHVFPRIWVNGWLNGVALAVQSRVLKAWDSPDDSDHSIGVPIPVVRFFTLLEENLIFMLSIACISCNDQVTRSHIYTTDAWLLAGYFSNRVELAIGFLVNLASITSPALFTKEEGNTRFVQQDNCRLCRENRTLCVVCTEKLGSWVVGARRSWHGVHSPSGLTASTCSGPGGAHDAVPVHCNPDKFHHSPSTC